MLKLHHMTCIFVFVVYVQPSYGAVMKVGAVLNYYIINIDQVNFQSLYQCLADGISQSCLLHLKDLNDIDKQYNVEEVTRGQNKTRLKPQFTCSFTLYSYGPGKDKVHCTQSSLHVTPQLTKICPQYDFIIKWGNTKEYFTDNSLANCSFDSTAVAYRSTSLPNKRTSISGYIMTASSTLKRKNITPIDSTKFAYRNTSLSSMTTSNNETGRNVEYNDVLLGVLISTSLLLFISIVVILYLSINLHRRRTTIKTNIYNFLTITKRDSHTYAITHPANCEQALSNANVYEDSDLNIK